MVPTVRQPIEPQPVESSAPGKIVQGGTIAWKKLVETNVGNQNFAEVQFISASAGRAISIQGLLYETMDQGKTWRSIETTLPTDGEVFSVFSVNHSLGWAILRHSNPDASDQEAEFYVIHTMDGGRSWQPQYKIKGGTLNTLRFISPNEGWAVGSRYYSDETEHNRPLVLHTTDYGRNWREVSSYLGTDNIDDSLEDVYASGPNSATVLSTDGELFTTSDGGKSWRSIGKAQGDKPQTAMFKIGG
jgi:photosystem II stability/assembly factor-like uncharacterized protein